MRDFIIYASGSLEEKRILFFKMNEEKEIEDRPPSVQLNLTKRIDLADAVARLCKVQLDTAMLRLETLRRSEDPKTAHQIDVCLCDLRVKEIEERIARVNRRQLQRTLAARMREEKRRKEGKDPIRIPEAIRPADAKMLGWDYYLKTCRRDRESSSSTKEMMSDKLTYAMTTFMSILRLGVLDGRPEELEVHIIGADWKEGRSKEQSMDVFRDLLVILGQIGFVKRVHITLVGPHIEVKMAGTSHKNLKVSDDPSVPTLSLTYSDTLYHKFNTQKTTREPHLVCAYNAGIWVFDEWTPTVLHVYRNMSCPLVITSYNLHESVEDRLTMEEIGVKPEHWCWKPELNVFRSLNSKKKTDKSVSDVSPNKAWQCIWRKRSVDSSKYSLTRCVEWFMRAFGE